MLDYRIIGSSSKGNVVRIGGIMIDCGMPFADMKPELYRCHSLLITHQHSGHMKLQTLNQVYKSFPRIKVYGNPAVAYRCRVNEVIGSEPFTLKDGIIVTPFEAVHDVPTTGFMIRMGEEDILYVTDTSEVNIPESRFDLSCQ